jgi:hypothetical protein
VTHANGEVPSLSLNVRGSQTGSNCMVFQGDRRSEDRHYAVARELIDGAAISLNNSDQRSKTSGMISRKLRTDRCGEVHRVHDIGEQNRHLLVLSSLRLRDGRAAFVTELRVDPQFRGAR